MKIHTLKFEQFIPQSLDYTWNFFSSPLNLFKITPAHMNFVITTDFGSGYKMYPGLLIAYKVSPLFGIKLNWVTEITHVKEKQYFIDEQRFGPFALWHHEHHFEEVPGGVLMKDILMYAVPFGFIGGLANKFIVARDVKAIFDFREQRIQELFEAHTPAAVISD